MKRRLIASGCLILAGVVYFGVFGRASKSFRGFSHYTIDELDEPSGLAASGRNKGIFWTHNDSGADPVLYATRVDGSLVGRFHVDGAKAVDWEAIATDRKGNLYIADVGNNGNWRRDLTIYRVLEPTVDHRNKKVVEGSLTVESSIQIHYPEQKRFPDLQAFNFDSEAIFWGESSARPDGALYLLTKHRSDTFTCLYRLDMTPDSKSIPLNLIGRYDLALGGGEKGLVTGAAMKPDGTLLAVLTYFGVFVFEQPTEGDNYLSRFKHKIDFDTDLTQQTEAIAWSGNTLIFSNEQGDLFRVEKPLVQRRVPLSKEVP